MHEFFGLLLSTLDITDFQPTDLLSSGDKVVVLGTSREGPKGSGESPSVAIDRCIGNATRRGLNI